MLSIVFVQNKNLFHAPRVLVVGLDELAQLPLGVVLKGDQVNRRFCGGRRVRFPNGLPGGGAGLWGSGRGCSFSANSSCWGGGLFCEDGSGALFFEERGGKRHALFFVEHRVRGMASVFVVRIEGLLEDGL